MHNQCPSCRKGIIFKSLLEMNLACQNCGYIFQKGSGYFVMSWFLNYILSGFIVMPVFLILVLKNYSAWVFIGVPLLILILIQPFMIRFSRLIWIHLDYKVSASKK